MGRYLMLDIGAGTLDILYVDSDHDLHYKAVVRSPVRVLADEIRSHEGSLVVTGGEMGGGPVSQVLLDRARTAQVVMSKTAAATIHHDVQRLMDRGIRVVAPQDAQALLAGGEFYHIHTADIQPKRIEQIINGFDVPFEFDAVAVCAQDHGAAPPGVSHLDYRHRMFTTALEGDPAPQTLLYRSGDVPKSLNRLTTLAKDTATLPTRQAYVMDSGMAAVLGASKDRLASGLERILVLDIATSHTVGAAMEAGELCGFFEYHTKDITVSRLDSLLRDLADGKLTHEQVLAEGGHGAYSRRAFGYDRVDCILATGPRRSLADASSLPITFGAPWGDNMMTGTVGLLAAVRMQEGLPAIEYI
ncbi:MAG: pyruvate formate-lyase activating enzyme [Proteobacteria bacterium]|nr:MAG: pyruvate formate-lyase activating enzyme [Pseudomonadota bacterium]